MNQKITITIGVFFLTFAQIFAQQVIEDSTEKLEEPKAEVVLEEKAPVFIIVEQMPEFPGGEDSLYEFIKKNIDRKIHSPSSKSKKVLLTFVIEKDGSISNIQILMGENKEYNGEAVRIMKIMPKWIPGRQNRFVVRTQFNLVFPFN
ncbi:MAG: hypothetical protein HGB12_04330 [Bacteroidetes bacterium]|nr:hypothetical protein [Bacteroidota bacterium]